MTGKSLRGLASFSLLSPSDTELIDRANATATDFAGADSLLHELFEASAAAHPDRIAVLHPGGSLTYAELAHRVTAVTTELLDLGLRPGDLVAIVMDKGWEQVVAALAVPAAGGVFVPLDPAVPTERLHQVLAHAGASVVVTRHGPIDLPAGTRVVRVGADTPPHAGPERRAPRRSPEDLAYVIYTSGSTGQPKGVMINHRGAVNTILDMNQRFAVVPDDRVLALSALTFDLAIYDIFGTLAAGAAIVLPSPSAVPDPDHWTDLVHRAGVTVWNSVPALMELAVATAKPGALAGLRMVWLSGDWIRVDLPADIAEVSPAAEVISLGGATEASIWSICHRIGEVDPSWPSIPYGRPMANQRFHILDRTRQPCPIGVPGDLYIGGVGVAMGYWRDDERTAASFVHDPRTGERIYRTGDLGRYLPDGEIQFLGRDDFQVKIQGFRIELGEVEAAVRRCPGVVDAVAVTDKDPSGSARLIAFARVEDDSLDPHTVRADVARRLPGYMVPASVVLVRSWPLTSNGKVDRNALLHAQDRETPGSGEPANAVEAVLAELWSETLDRDTVGTQVSFFDLGGQSLLAARLTMAINAIFDIDVPVRAVFEAPTVSAFSDWLAIAPGVDAVRLQAVAEELIGVAQLQPLGTSR